MVKIPSWTRVNCSLTVSNPDEIHKSTNSKSVVSLQSWPSEKSSKCYVAAADHVLVCAPSSHATWYSLHYGTNKQGSISGRKINPSLSLATPTHSFQNAIEEGPEKTSRQGQDRFVELLISKTIVPNLPLYFS